MSDCTLSCDFVRIGELLQIEVDSRGAGLPTLLDLEKPLISEHIFEAIVPKTALSEMVAAVFDRAIVIDAGVHLFVGNKADLQGLVRLSLLEARGRFSRVQREAPGRVLALDLLGLQDSAPIDHLKLLLGCTDQLLGVLHLI